MGKIFIIGGGEISKLEILSFDKRIVELTGKKHPNALFIPTASSDSLGYIETFNKVYGEKLGCKTDALLLLNRKPSKKELREKIFSSDLIYVGGGNTLKMMKRWRFLGVDKILKEAYKKGIMLSGISAGGICWFDAGCSDSMSFYHKNYSYIKVKGLGLLKGIHCPHFNEDKRGIERKKAFLNLIEKQSAIGIALDNHCAIEFVNDKYKVLSLKKGRKAFRIFKKDKKMITEEIPQQDKYSPISALYKIN